MIKWLKAGNIVLVRISVVVLFFAMQVQAADSGTVSYEPAFFAPNNPVTALDIVDRVPGFRLQRQEFFSEQEQVRGFGGAAADVLINGNRPSTKSVPIEDILQRISAKDVIRVDLIRGATGSLDSSKASVVVNLIVEEREGWGSAPWEASLHLEDGHIIPNGKIAWSGNGNATSYTFGMEREKFEYDFSGPEILTNYVGPDEYRDEITFVEENKMLAYINTETRRGNGDIFRFNSQFTRTDNWEREESLRYPEGAEDPNLVDQDAQLKSDDVEFGGDYERSFTETLRLKAIAVVTRKSSDYDSQLTSIPVDGIEEITFYSAETEEGESIGRLEFNWRGRPSHTLQFGGELVQNFLDNEADLFFDDGSGAEEIPLPGGNTRVEELRGEAFVTDSWVANKKMTIDFGIAIEVSEIEQTGDTDLRRRFTYPKPSLALTYSPDQRNQWRLELAREVGQLDFNEFVSSVNFHDEDLDLGNPDLEPEQTWVLEVAYEHRFSSIGVIEISPFYHWINDVEDLVPIGGLYDAPGNIGDGERWGVKLKLSSGFEFIGIENARLDVSYKWQDSSVTDPVTGEDRELSNERPWSYDIDFRKDFPASNASIGAKYVDRADTTAYGLHEIIAENYTPGLSAFYEVVLGSGYKLRFEGFNLLTQGGHRDREVYLGTRASGILAFTENRKRDDESYFSIKLSGVF